MTTVPDLCARKVACILDDIPLDVGQLVVNEMDHFKNQGGVHLFFPSLITELSRRAGVEEYASDTWVHPGAPSHLPLEDLRRGRTWQRKQAKD